MDFGDEDELDFEEDLPENELKKSDAPENESKKSDAPENESKKSDVPENAEKKIEDSDINGCDQYLQIDCLDDEEDLLSKVSLDSEKAENTVHDKEPNTKDSVKEENKKPQKKKECAENKRDKNSLNKNFKKAKGKKRKERSFGVPLYRAQKSLCSNRLRSGINFMKQSEQNIGQGLTGLPLQYPKLHHFSQNYFQNQSDFVSLLGLSAAKNQTGANLQQINSLSAQCSNPMLEVRKNLTRNGLMGPCSNAMLNQFQCNDFSRFKGDLQQKLAADSNNKNFPVISMNSLKTDSNRESFNVKHSDKNLPQGEKELKSKKEARLLRFMNDDTNKKEIKSIGNSSGKPVVQSLNLEKEYFRKMEEQKRKRQEIFSLKEKQNLCNEKSATDALAINKELLLKKENPFGNGCKMLENNSVKFEIKQEKEEKKKQEEMVSQNGNLPLEKLCFIKKEAKSPVKFVRTVSKTFEELGLSKTKNGLFSRIDDRSKSDIPVDNDSVSDNVPKAELVDTASQTQTEPHLTGCIVKVLNVPPATTANDVLALFSPFGIVRELKLNFPKENSVAIRFAEPKSAENFFKLYNGRVFDSRILNVIIV